METAGKLVEEEELREAMKDSGIGTPATRAAIIERLLQVGYIERDGRALVVTEKGLNVIRLLGEHPLTSPGLTGDWEHRLANIEIGRDSREKFMGDIVKFTESTVGELDTKLKDVRIPRANLGPCPVCGRDINENRKGYSCWGREDPGCGFVIWKAKAGKQLPIAVARELIKTGRTEKAVTGFKGRSGKSFRARLALMQNEEGKWRVEFDEPWAKEGAKPPEAEEPPPTAPPRAPRPPPSSPPPPERRRAGLAVGTARQYWARGPHPRPRPGQLRQGGGGAGRLRRRRPPRRAAGGAHRRRCPPLRPRAGRRRGGARLGAHLQRPGLRGRPPGASTPAGASRAPARADPRARRGRLPARRAAVVRLGARASPPPPAS